MSVIMEDEVKTLKNDIQELKNIVHKQTLLLEQIQKSCNNMVSHINFVEYIYSKCVMPLNYIRSYFLNNHDSLPLTYDNTLMIDHKKIEASLGVQL